MQKNADMDEEIARAHSIGKQLWTPDVEFDRHSFEFVHPLCRLMLTAGMAVGETASDVDALLATVEKGMAEAKAEHGQEIQTHGERAQCDPDGKYPMCEYCQAYARSMASSAESSSVGRRRPRTRTGSLRSRQPPGGSTAAKARSTNGAARR